MLQLLGDADERDRLKEQQLQQQQRPPAPPEQEEAPATAQRPPAQKTASRKKRPSKKPGGLATGAKQSPREPPPLRPLAPRPIAPKPDPASQQKAVASRASLAARLDALAADDVVDAASARDARVVLASADEFILLHLDDALADLEKPNGDGAKLALLLDIHASVQDYLVSSSQQQQPRVPASVDKPLRGDEEDEEVPAETSQTTLRAQIDAKKDRAVRLRTQQNLDEAILLMREAKQLEHRLERLRVGDDGVAAAPAPGDDVEDDDDDDDARGFDPLTVFDDDLDDDGALAVATSS
mmetsp:Transcript_17721/g.71134  ORF Transcript_17721/g.71134 Transcript_17721/m.71134 type:complete len:297 (+) Transcript_17721:1521-2411(+)